jgi:hypothetical protein
VIKQSRASCRRDPAVGILGPRGVRLGPREHLSCPPAPSLFVIPRDRPLGRTARMKYVLLVYGQKSRAGRSDVELQR